MEDVEIFQTKDAIVIRPISPRGKHMLNDSGYSQDKNGNYPFSTAFGDTIEETAMWAEKEFDITYKIVDS